MAKAKRLQARIKQMIKIPIGSRVSTLNHGGKSLANRLAKSSSNPPPPPPKVQIPEIVEVPDEEESEEEINFLTS